MQIRQQAELLDSIDRLRRDSIGTELDIPQMVVCADHSSDKDTLLESITRMPSTIIRTKIRCAMELVLRYAPNPCIYACIQPAPHRSTSEREYLGKFRHSSRTTSLHDYLDLFKAAVQHLEKFKTDCGYWYEVLRVEISGPSQTPLTLIDLPGIKRVVTDDHSLEVADADAILDLARYHLLKPRTIVLAVVNAMWDGELALIRDLINSPFAINKRTLGVITRPEGAIEKADVEQMVGLMRNTDLQLGLGWHVVKSLHYKEKDRSLDNRDLQEAEFFKSGRWSGLTSTDTGIAALREKLSRCLFDGINEEMPKLLDDMTQQLNADCRK